MRKLKGGTRKGAKRWPSKLLLQLVIESGSVANSRKGIDPKWPVSVALMVSIYRDESAKMKMIDNFNLTVPTSDYSTRDKGDFD